MTNVVWFVLSGKWNEKEKSTKVGTSVNLQGIPGGNDTRSPTRWSKH